MTNYDTNLYTEGIGRNEGEEHQKSHLYKDESGSLMPMCRKGWNRSDGAGFSILRTSLTSAGRC